MSCRSNKILLIALKVLLGSVVHVDKYSNFILCVKIWLLAYQMAYNVQFCVSTSYFSLFPSATFFQEGIKEEQRIYFTL